MITRKRIRIGAVATAVAGFLTAVVVVGSQEAHEAPQLQLHAGSAWLASNKVGQMTLLDGASAEVAARVNVAPAGSPLAVSQEESNGYAVNRHDGSVIRVDGATQDVTRSAPAMADTIFPTPETLHALNSARGLLAPADPVTLTPRGAPQPLAAQIGADGSVVDANGHLWVFDDRTGDLVWFDGGRQSRGHAGTPGKTQLTVANGAPALMDVPGRQVSFLDPSTGEVDRSAQPDLRPDDVVAVSGSPRQQRMLISVASRGLLMVCTSSCAAPIPLGTGAGQLGAPLEAHEHAIVPDYATGRVWIVDLASMRVVVEKQLFDRPVKFELLTRDGVIFYNDPDTDQAGVLELDGRVRAVVKYDTSKPDRLYPAQVANNRDDTRRPPNAPPNTNRTGQQPPISGPGNDPNTPVRPGAAIVVKPSDHGLVGDDFDFTVVASAEIASARWTFGDGTNATGVNVRHHWDRPSQFLVSVAATLTSGQAVPITSTTVTVDPLEAPPRITRFIITPAAPVVGQPVSFGADVFGRTDRWEWAVRGPQGFEVGSDKHSFEHTFATPGTYQVTLTLVRGAQRVPEQRSIAVADKLPPVHCGAVLTASASLDRDLICPGQGATLTLAAPNITLDLQGKTISAQRPDPNGSVGILVHGSGSKIFNGNISNFATGINVTDASGVTLSGVHILSSSFDSGTTLVGGDVRTTRAPGTILNGMTLEGAVGFVFDDNSKVTVNNSAIAYHDTPTAPVTKMQCSGNSDCTIAGGTINAANFFCQRFNQAPTSNITITADAIAQVRAIADGTGGRCSSLTVENSTISLGTMSPVQLTLTGNTSLPNTFNSVKDANFTISGNVFTGFTVESGSKGTITGNTFQNAPGYGLAVKGGGGQVTVIHNTFQGNGTAGEADSGGLFVDPGVEGRSVIITENTGDDIGFDIKAEPRGVADGGRNTSTKGESGCIGRVRCTLP
ncbi:PKD domain-containing protein [Actinocrispum sp. NPDC049592]|uniref:PKD domain-containing protein n=1 Tax=Actinocrispum sp. NPDC049592 TaxID=3154835 RepID=UPI003423D367